VPYHDVNEFYEQARVYVNTSEIEGFPNSYLQAWVRGTPVIAYFDPDGLIAREGLGVAVSTQEELIEAIRSLTTDATRWREASRRCRDFMRRRFSEDQVLQPYVEAFSSTRCAHS
jgi:glycosyltransferase involved in cell wall biosynthesis